MRAVVDTDKFQSQTAATLASAFNQVRADNLPLVAAIAKTIPNSEPMFVDMGKGEYQQAAKALAGQISYARRENSAILGAHQKNSFLVSSPGTVSRSRRGTLFDCYISIVPQNGGLFKEVYH